PGILAGMATEHSDATGVPDEFDRKLRELYSGTAGEAKFREPSAAERAKSAASRRRASLSLRRAGQARKLRRLATSGQSGRPVARGRSWRRLRRPASRPEPTRRPAPGDRRRRLVSLAKAAGILVGFVALLLLMHVLGLGPH
ncbi:MAG TPA: hypothetical protein VFW16_14545, partial [Streptosporangiaceae bacterium]|nr:hypothetical protein [Streptosporangiaceae bacterium]